MPNFTLGLVGRNVQRVMDVGNVVENIFGTAVVIVNDFPSWRRK